MILYWLWIHTTTDGGLSPTTSSHCFREGVFFSFGKLNRPGFVSLLFSCTENNLTSFPCGIIKYKIKDVNRQHKDFSLTSRVLISCWVSSARVSHRFLKLINICDEISIRVCITSGSSHINCLSNSSSAIPSYGYCTIYITKRQNEIFKDNNFTQEESRITITKTGQKSQIKQFFFFWYLRRNQGHFAILVTTVMLLYQCRYNVWYINMWISTLINYENIINYWNHRYTHVYTYMTKTKTKICTLYVYDILFDVWIRITRLTTNGVWIN